MRKFSPSWASVLQVWWLWPAVVLAHPSLKKSSSFKAWFPTTRDGHEVLHPASPQFVSVVWQPSGWMLLSPTPSLAPPLTHLCASAGLSSRAGCPVQAGAWASLHPLLQQPATVQAASLPRLLIWVAGCAPGDAASSHHSPCVVTATAHFNLLCHRSSLLKPSPVPFLPTTT